MPRESFVFQQSNLKKISENKSTGYVEVEQIIMSTSLQEAAVSVQNAGMVLQSISEVKPSLWNKEVVSREYKAQFLQALAFNVEAGMSAGKALEVVLANEPNPNLQMQFHPALMVLSRGGEFSDAVRHLNIFDESTVSILVSGEHTGSMKEATQSAIDRFQSRNYASKMVAGVLSWSGLDLAMTVSSIMGVQYKFLPDMEKNYSGNENPEKQEAFKQAIELAYFLNGTLLWVAVAVMCFAAWMAGGMIVARPGSEWRRKAEGILRKIPGIGAFIRDNAIADTFSIVSSMLKGSVRLTTAIQIAKSASGFPAIRAYWDEAMERIYLGESVSRALSQPLLSSSEQLVISTHQTSAQLAKVMGDIAKDKEEKSAVLAKKVSFWFLMISLAYGGMSVLIYVWLLMMQNDQLLSVMGK